VDSKEQFSATVADQARHPPDGPPELVKWLERDAALIHGRFRRPRRRAELL